ncbi:MAG TPA: TetR/AcrR family transcriptional regulator [Candidatus Acidoferrales bacterium]|nr:TetR/AcrR family transcriptional regulator [Candidatus Acidoferrales bacterium]
MHRGRKKVDNPETARRILSAAERIFAAEGLAGARTEEIARAAHVNKAMLYYYFDSKEKLYRAVFENLFGQAGRTIEMATRAGASGRQAILAFMEGYFRFRIEHPNYARLMQHMVMEDPKQYRWVAREYFEPRFKQLSKLIQQGVANGEFEAIDANHTVINILAMIVFYFSGAPMHSELLGRDALDPRAIAEHKRAVMDLLEHGLFRRTARMRPAKKRPVRIVSVRTSDARTS